MAIRRSCPGERYLSRRNRVRCGTEEIVAHADIGGMPACRGRRRRRRWRTSIPSAAVAATRCCYCSRR